MTTEVDRLIQAEVDRREARRARNERIFEQRGAPEYLRQIANELARIARALESIDNQMRDDLDAQPDQG